MDDSVRLFNEEQGRLAADGGPIAALKRQLISSLINLVAFGAVLASVMAGVGALPRNPDNSMKLIYFGPVLTVLALVAALLLRQHVLDRLRLRPVLWALIAVAAIAVPVGLIGAVSSNVS